MLKQSLVYFVLPLVLLFSNTSEHSFAQPKQKFAVLLPRQHSATTEGVSQLDLGKIPGPDVVVGDITAVAQAGSAGDYVGIGIGTTSCNYGTIDLDQFAAPSNDHSVIPQNLYRMSGGTTNTERFEQIGQSWVAHTFTALSQNICNLGCNGVSGSHLGSGCSDPTSASLNSSQSNLGSRAWVNPFTGYFPGSNPRPNDHTGHVHTAVSHRLRVAISDLNTTLNPGATYFAEGQYVTPHEHTWCQSNPGQCNMYNNVSYRQFSVSGTTTFTFTAVAPTDRQRPAIMAWTEATINQFEPAPGIDGIGFIGYKVTNPSPGVWHYEYAIYNENLDRAVRLFSVPLGCGIALNNLGFHAPPQEPGWLNDGTCNNQGYSSTPWSTNQTTNTLTWFCETFAQNCNANAIRWGTLYNFRFDSNKPPQPTSATLGFFKTGSPITVSIQAPAPDPCIPFQMLSVVSRKIHGDAGDFDIDMPLAGAAGVECRSTGGNHTFVFTFNNNVVSGSAEVTAGSGSISGNPSFSGNTMTVNLSGVTDAQTLTVTVSGVIDAFGQTLPDTAVTASFLAGDVNQNRAVSASDIAMTKAQLGQPVTSSNFTTDVNANGSINAGDVSMVKSNVGAGLP